MTTIPQVSTCANCGNPLPQTNRHPRKYCSLECSRMRDNRQRYGKHSQSLSSRLQISTGAIGALSELVACADLMRHGYHVFRAVSPDAPCDLIATRGSVVLRVEVRTGYYTADNRLMFSRAPKDAGRYDVYAVVLDGTDVEYMPPLASVTAL